MKATAEAAPLWHDDDELDVRFAFSDAAAGPELESNLAPQLEALAAGAGRRGAVQPAVSDDAMVDRLDAAARAARVERLLRAIGPVHAAVLAAAYQVDQVIPPATRRRYGQLAGVVLVVGEGGGGELPARDRAREALEAAQAAYAAARFTARRR